MGYYGIFMYDEVKYEKPGEIVKKIELLENDILEDLKGLKFKFKFG
jgi:hypothetical protein